MQWVVTTGRTVDAARARALDALGIDDEDLEFEVLDAGSTSLFGLRVVPARVRARVKPTRPRPKLDRRNRRTKGGGPKRSSGGGRRRGRKTSRRDSSGSDSQTTADGDADTTPDTDTSTNARTKPDSAPREASKTGPRSADKPKAKPDPGQPATSSDITDEEPAPRAASSQRQGAAMSDIALSEQEPTAVAFVEGLVEAFGADADVTVETTEDGDALEIAVEGEDLGLLVGQKGATLSAIQELTRTAVAQQHSGRLEGRLRVDVAGYRARRNEALVRFAQKLAAQVNETGTKVALEPMSPPDRKVVHDAVNEIDGVYTSSEGEDRRRHVVIHPDS